MKNELDYLLYGLDSSKKLLYSKWAMPIGSQQYKNGLQQLAQLIHNNEIQLWIHESRRMNELSMEDQKWTTEVLALVLTQTNLKHIAIVRPADISHTAPGNSLREKAYRIYGKNVGIEFFDTTEEAKAWILPHLQHYKLPALSTPVSLD
ncbi:hypothetical protein [Pontibacter cellulosilyticus]|uniref:STAS/SEC14 domain-containing protein n=1 Tax=Pontibacter cellulosilyticus TaxID=1720253 RepID=A0A923N1R0_9BACT|nr:hypothetical protein [Pontibacter cellulosilyticus]MBC5991245.1 hypothetical protein [Pontibacter cellulosilyticus]